MFGKPRQSIPTAIYTVLVGQEYTMAPIIPASFLFSPRSLSFLATIIHQASNNTVAFLFGGRYLLSLACVFSKPCFCLDSFWTNRGHRCHPGRRSTELTRFGGGNCLKLVWSLFCSCKRGWFGRYKNYDSRGIPCSQQ